MIQGAIMIKEFKASVHKASKAFIKQKCSYVRVISHLDADGLCSAAIIIQTLKRLGIAYNLTIVQQVDKELIDELLKEHYKVYIFTDLGSNVDIVKRLCLKKELIIVLDHHEIKRFKQCDNLIVANPKLYGLDDQISGAGVCYLFSKELINDKSLSYLAIIGAVGDLQHRKGFKGLNKEILKEALEENVITVEKSPNLFWLETKPLVKVLQHSKDIIIPNITGSESGVIQFLQSIGIKPTANGKWRFFRDLTKEEVEKLTTAIIIALNNRNRDTKNQDPVKYINKKSDYSKVIIERYRLVGRQNTFSDIREFATIINACGRLGKPLVGIAACLGDRKAEKAAEGLLQAYKRQLLDALRFLTNKTRMNDPNIVFKSKRFIAFRAGSYVEPSIIGTVTSMIASDSIGSKFDFVIGLADNIDGTVKISARVGKRLRNDENVNLKELLEVAVKSVDGEVGGHQHAAGAVINKNKELEFLNACKQIFESFQSEEKVRL